MMTSRIVEDGAKSKVHGGELPMHCFGRTYTLNDARLLEFVRGGPGLQKLLDLERTGKQEGTHSMSTEQS